MFKGATKFDEKAQTDLIEALDFFETFLGQTKYAAGDHLTIADVTLLSSASTFVVNFQLRTLQKKISFINVVLYLQATDKTVFDKHPKIQSWLETCKAEIPEYEDVNGRGAEAFGQWASAALAKMESS